MDTLVKVKIDELTVGEFNSQYKTYQTAIVVSGNRRTGFVSEKKIEEVKQAHANGQLIELVFYTNGTYENFKLPTKTDKLDIELEKIKAFLKTKFPEDFNAKPQSNQPITDSINEAQDNRVQAENAGNPDEPIDTTDDEGNTDDLQEPYNANDDSPLPF